MGKIFFYFSTMLIILISIPPSCNSQTLKLGTATKGGNYFRLGESIKSICSKQTSLTIEVIEIRGSMDNINKIDSGQLDLIIVQNDIAFLAENGLYPFDESAKDLRSIIAFFLSHSSR